MATLKLPGWASGIGIVLENTEIWLWKIIIIDYIRKMFWKYIITETYMVNDREKSAESDAHVTRSKT